MMKLILAAALGACFCMPEAAAQSLIQRSDWQDRKFEIYLPRVDTTVPWLNIDTKTRLPKGDIPLGRNVASVGQCVPVTNETQMSTVPSSHRSM